ncbi:MAG: hypothetical protein V1749_03315 [Candidatus Desantisbacteria bacterium]
MNLEDTILNFCVASDGIVLFFNKECESKISNNVETEAAILAETVSFTNTEELSAKITELVNKIAKRVAEQ